MFSHGLTERIFPDESHFAGLQRSERTRLLLYEAQLVSGSRSGEVAEVRGEGETAGHSDVRAVRQVTGGGPRVRALTGPRLPAVVRDITGVGAAQTLPGSSPVSRHVTEGEVGGQGENLARSPDQSLSVSFAAHWEGSFAHEVGNLQLFILHSC